MKGKEKLEAWRKEYETPHMTEKQLEDMKSAMEKAKEENRRAVGKKHIWQKGIAAAAAAFLILPNMSATAAQAMEQIPVFGSLVEVVTLREYQYQDERNHADVKVPQIALSDGAGDVLQRSAAEINAEIQKIAEKFIADFKEDMKTEGGYQNIGIDSVVISTTPEYFTLKLTCYQASGSGMQWDRYYTIDMETGERLPLKALFVEEADYISPISESIKVQMAEQMQADENILYWLDSGVAEWDFQNITEETEFYINEKGNIVISFDEGEVAPMYMGVVTFEIPAEVVVDIRK